MGTTGGGTIQQIGIGGTVHDYGVLVLGDVVMIERGGEEVARRRIEGLGRFAAEAKGLKLGWGQFPDGAEVIYLCDAGGDGWGYALNLACDWCSEWGYAPFG